LIGENKVFKRWRNRIIKHLDYKTKSHYFLL